MVSTLGASSGDRLSGFRKLARDVHPDKNRHPQAAEAFKRLNQIVLK
jgi:DnaJ family protein B protein 12